MTIPRTSIQTIATSLIAGALLFSSASIGPLAIAAGKPAAAQPVAHAPQKSDPVAAAQSLLDDLQHADDDAVFARFDDTMKSHVSAAQLKAVWESLAPKMGALQQRGTPTSKQQDGITVVTIPLVFANGRLAAVVASGADGKVVGLVIQPESAPAPPARTDLPSHEVAFGPAGRTLPGTLELPRSSKAAQRFPAVVMVHGSGPQDRDESVAGTRVFRDLADGLAERGVASLRYDKRTKARPQDFTGAFTIDDETTDDAVAAVAFLRSQPGIDPAHIYVIGHSQGAMMAPRIAQVLNSAAGQSPQLAGIVLMAAPARPLEDVLVDQTTYMAMDDGKIDAAERGTIDALEVEVAKLKKLDGSTPPTNKLLLGLPASYWRSLQGYDDVAVAKTIPQPMLILQGDRDFQVTAPDWTRWQRAFGTTARATIKFYPALNHLFVGGSTGRGSIAEYSKPAHVDATVIADIAAWIKAR